jgi:hypothetical protein
MADEERDELQVDELIVTTETEIPLAQMGKTMTFAAIETDPGAGRRDTDTHRVMLITSVERTLRDAFFWLFGMFLETKPPHKPSISRVSWWLMVWVGIAMFVHEMTLTQCAKPPSIVGGSAEATRRALAWAHELGHCGVPISNAAWQAWAIAFGACSVAVFGPKMIEFWKTASGALTAIGAAVRDARDPREPSIKDDETRDK